MPALTLANVVGVSEKETTARVRSEWMRALPNPYGVFGGSCWLDTLAGHARYGSRAFGERIELMSQINKHKPSKFENREKLAKG